jgi:amino acid permease
VICEKCNSPIKFRRRDGKLQSVPKAMRLIGIIAAFLGPLAIFICLLTGNLHSRSVRGGGALFVGAIISPILLTYMLSQFWKKFNVYKCKCGNEGVVWFYDSMT